MEKPTLFALGGALAATLIVGIGVANTYRLERNLKHRYAECIAERKKPSLAKSFGGVLICDPEQLYMSSSSDHPIVGIQAKLVETQGDVNRSKTWYPPLAMAVLFISALPWLWYFLLRRIRELRNAILGK